MNDLAPLIGLGIGGLVCGLLGLWLWLWGRGDIDPAWQDDEEREA